MVYEFNKSEINLGSLRRIVNRRKGRSEKRKISEDDGNAEAAKGMGD